MKLLIDIGNTRAKIRVVDGDKIVLDEARDCFGSGEADALTARYPIDAAILSSVRERDAALCRTLEKAVGRFIELKGTTPVWFNVDCPTPELIGADRLAAAAGAAAMFPRRNVLIVDFGTAITVDTLTADGSFRCGNISLGATARLRALHSITAKLPEVMLSEATEELMGNSTETEMANGVAWGITFEIEEYMRRHAEKFNDSVVIFTGGDAFFFEKRIKNTIFAESDLALTGLDRILDYNED